MSTTDTPPPETSSPTELLGSSPESANRSVTIIDPTGRIGEVPLALRAVKPPEGESIDRIVFVLPVSASRWTESVLGAITERIGSLPFGSEVRLVSSVRAIFDPAFAELERETAHELTAAGAEPIVLRIGHAFVPGSRFSRWASRLGPFAPLVPASLHSVFVSEHELSELLTIDQLPTTRPVVVLGTNRPLREVIDDHRRSGPVTGTVRAIAWVLSWLLLGRLFGLLFAIAARVRPAWNLWRLRTLRPSDSEELLALTHRLNRSHVALAGYNTGVDHFGWNYPGRTVVQTLDTGDHLELMGDLLTVDAGVLLVRVIRELAAADRELFVIPNYSYISMGTVFMVPVHGSGSDASTLGETIEAVQLFDPATDRTTWVTRDDAEFGRSIYHPDSEVVVLRLKLRTRPASRYRMEEARLDNPTTEELWTVFDDPDASNVELRQAAASDDHVEVRKFYAVESANRTETAATGDGEELARDGIGRIWDRIEETRPAAWAFHTLVRTFGFHVELFLDRREFDLFWDGHGDLPLKKLQLRRMRADGLSGSPFRDADLISIDLFMSRRNSAAFLDFMHKTLPDAQYNPGKHSM